jgi:NADPH-dependent curcumin reductase CurA
MPTATVSREIHLAVRPHGSPGLDAFSWVDRPVSDPAPGEVVVANTYLSVDPYMRGRMDDVPSYIPRWPVGAPLDGAAVGVVVASEAPALPVGTAVEHQLSWREVAVGPAERFAPIDLDGVSPSAYLGVLGAPGLIAWVGINDVARVEPGETVFVSGAAGAVGSVAGQIARLKGAGRVIGSAGSREKVAYLRDELGFDAAFNYHDGPIAEQLAAAAPDGIDVFFDNVGGEHLEAAIGAINLHGRLALCGAISGHNDLEPAPGPRNLFELIARRVRAEGFLVLDHLDRMAAFRAQARRWLRDGDLIARETVVDGLDAMPDALFGLYRGDNIGKMVVRLGENR